MRVFWHFLLILLLLPCCIACSHQEKVNSEINTLIVSRQADVDTLYLNGAIEPLKIISVIAPFDGVITQKQFDYGELIKQQQLLFILDSSQFNDSYQDALSSYLKTKKDYANNVNKMRDTEELKKLGIISRDEYQTDQNQIYDSSLALAEATRKLQMLLIKANAQRFDLTSLNTNDIQSVSKLLLQNTNQLNIYATDAGIALLPTKDNSGGDDSNKPLHVGDQIKSGQVLLTIGDITGIVLSVKINEIHINDIKIGQQAVITSNAFNDTLTGQVIHVDQQATQDNNDTLPSFTVKIAVPKITEAQRKVIHVGMSAKVALQVVKPGSIRIPLTAVIANNGQTFVQLLDKPTKKIKQVPVVTGPTSIDSIVIQQGLQPGDEVVIHADNKIAASQ